MLAIGLLVAFIGYSLLYWAINAFQGNSQGKFITYIFPWAGSH